MRKSGVLKHKNGNIPETRIKIEEKLLRRAYRNSSTLFRTIPPPTPYGLLFPKIGGLQPPKLQSLLSPEWIKLYGLQSWPLHCQVPSEQKPIKNFGEKAAWVYPGTAQMFWIPLLSQEPVKLRTSNFVRTFTGSTGTKVH